MSTFYEYPPEVRKIIYTTNIIEGLNRQFRQITKNKPSFTNDDSLRRMLYLAAQRIQKHWHARCQNWDLVRSQLQLMFADRVAHCALSLDCPCVWDGIHASGAHTAPPTGTIGVEGLQPTFCTVSTAPDLTLSKIAYTRFYGVLNDMVKAVYVHAPDKSKGHREQQIDISYDMWEYSPRLY